MASPNTNPVRKHFTMTIKDFYGSYKKHKKASNEEPQDYKTYRKAMEDFFTEVSKKIIYENFTFMMPYSLGTVVVKAFKNPFKDRYIDWKTTKEVGKIVRHLNTHSFGYYFGIVWDKSYVRFRNNAYYTFTARKSDKATRNGIGKKALSKHIRELAKDPTKRAYIKI